MPASISPSTSEQRLNLSESRIKDSLIAAYDSYQRAFDKGDMLEQRYWDGYIRALHYACDLGGLV